MDCPWLSLPCFTLLGVSEVFSCSGCEDKWTGQKVAHCSVCHRGFNTARLFDDHRQRDKCVDPETIGMVIGFFGRWHYPLPEDYKRKIVHVEV